MNAEDERHQNAIHAALSQALELDDGEMLTGWIVAYETRTGDEAYAGHCYGPESMTSWHAQGLLAWASKVTLPRSLDDDEDE